MTYRRATESCALCREERDQAELEPLAGLPACERCRSGELEAALAAHELSEEHKRYYFHSPTGGGSGWRCHVEIKRPTRPELIASMKAESGFDNWFSRLFRKADPQIGVEDFDKQVKIEVDPEHEDALRAALEPPGAREAVIQLIGRGCSVSLFMSLVSTGVETWTEDGLPPLAELRKYIVALAVHLERSAPR